MVVLNFKGLKPLLVYDGDCGFCLKWVQYWQGLLGDRLDFEAYQKISARFPEIEIQQFQEFEEAVHLIEPSGRVSRGAEAIFRTLALNPRYRWFLRLYLGSSVVRYVAERTYRFVAEHRILVSRLTQWF
jgi:lipase maturation factor 1